MIDELRELNDQIEVATQRLLATAETLTDDAVREASLLPGWTRGHVLTHIARTADALGNLLVWARTGVPTPAYASQAARDQAIDAGATRTAAELLADLAKTAERFRAEVAAMPAHAWQTPVRVFDRPAFPASEVLVRRLCEVELHHTDLGVGYGPDDWPARFAGLDLPEPMCTQRADRQAWSREAS